MAKTPESPTNPDHDPQSIAEIVEGGVEEVLYHQPDPERVATNKVKNLYHDVGEQADAREGMIEANQAGQAEHDLTVINQGLLQARTEQVEAETELEQTVRRHPSNRDKK